MEHEKEEEHLVFVIRATNAVETKMKKIISSFIKTPDEKMEFVNSYLLNNSTMPFGSKVKLIIYLAKELGVKVNRESFHTMLSRRNAFAHQDHFESIRVIEDGEGYPDVAFIVESIKGSGSLEAVTQENAFAEFMGAYIAVEKCLDLMLKELND